MGLQRADVEHELEQILASPSFDGSDRTRAFLNYVVKCELDGNGARIKAYTLGTDVMGRSDSFDPNTDSIVRVEAGRLRRALELYYATEGAANPVRILLNRGSYRPEFASAIDPVPSTAPRETPGRSQSHGVLALFFLAVVAIVAFASQQTMWPQISRDGNAVIRPASLMQGPSILAEPFANMTQDAALDVIATGLTNDTIAELARFRWLVVYAGLDTDDGSEAGRDPMNDSNGHSRYVLIGQVSGDDGRFSVSARLESSQDNAVVWADTYSAAMTADNLINVQRKIAESIAVPIGPPNGIIGRIEQQKSLRDTTSSLAAYQCVMLAHVYWRSFDSRTHSNVRDCLEQSIGEDRDYAEALASLAFITLDEFRYQYNPRTGYDPLVRAARYAADALAADPLSSLAAQAEFTIALYQDDRDRFERVGRRAIDNNPNNPDLLADFGAKLALTYGDWASGIPLIQRAWMLNPSPPPWSYIGPAYYAYLEGRIGDAESLIERAGGDTQLNFVLLRIAISRMSDNPQELAAAIANARANAIKDLDDAMAVLERLNLSPGLNSRLSRDLQSAYAAYKPHS